MAEKLKNKLSNKEIEEYIAKYRKSPEWHAKSSGKTDVVMAPHEYLMALPENALAEAALGIGSKLMSPLVKYGVSKVAPKISELASTATKNYYQKAPWTWKPNPENYYRAGYGKEFLDDVVNTNKVRAYNKNSFVNKQKTGEINGIRDVSTGKISLKAKDFPEPDAYFSKGTPLDARYSNQKYGDHIIEASNDIPFVSAVNQKTKWSNYELPNVEANAEHTIGAYVKPRQSYGVGQSGKIESSAGSALPYDKNNIKLLKPSLIFGYKPYKFGGPLNEESLLGNKIENYPSEYVFNSYLNQPNQYGFGSWMNNNGQMNPMSGNIQQQTIDQSQLMPMSNINSKSTRADGQAINDMSDSATNAIGMAGPYGAAISAVSKLGDGIGGAVGGDTGNFISGTFNPLKALKAWERSDISTGNKILGTAIPGIGNALAQRSIEKEAREKEMKPILTQIAMNRANGQMANGGYVPNFGNSVGNQLLAPIAGSIQKDQTQSEYDELGIKKVSSELTGGRIEYGTGGNLKELSANWYLPKDTYSHGGSFDFMMANGGAIQPLIDDVDGSNMKSPSTNTNIYTGGNSEFTERRGGIEVPNPDTSVINNGGLHENSPLGGVPIGNKALVEEGEVIYKDKSGKKYVFSNKIIGK